ncbi:zinc-binding dehydrogenase [Halospeciosus flavus]
MAANVEGCTDIIAVDLKDSRREKALELGATAAIDPNNVDDVVETIREQTDGGVQYALETTGVPDVAEQAVDVLTQRGTTGIVGAPPLGSEASYDINDLLINGREIVGIVEGDAQPTQFIPTLIDLYQQGEFPFDELVTYYDFADIEQAVADSEAGETIKPILRMDHDEA